MTGLPIKDFSKLISVVSTIKTAVDNNSQKIQDLIDLLRPQTIGEASDMEIPLKIKLLFGTGDNLGKDTPISLYQEMGSAWESIMTAVIDSNKGVTGYKLAKLDSFQPGKSYGFNVVVNPNFSDFDNNRLTPVEVFLIDSNQALAAMMAAVAAGFLQDGLKLSRYVPRFIGYMKRDGFITKLPPSGGGFSVTPGNTHSLLHFCIQTNNDGGQGAVITSFNKEANTFVLGGY